MARCLLAGKAVAGEQPEIDCNFLAGDRDAPDA
jgi:hypothetical protein